MVSFQVKETKALHQQGFLLEHLAPFVTAKRTVS